MSTIANAERIDRIRHELRDEGFDALVCALPANVLMLTGYWPVAGTSFAIATSDGEIALLIPEDELDLTVTSWATRIRTYRPASLERLQPPAEPASEALRILIHAMKIHCTRIGYEFGPFSEPASYASMNLFGPFVIAMLRTAAPSAAIAPADLLIERLTTAKTPVEIERIRQSCGIAREAFERCENGRSNEPKQHHGRSVSCLRFLCKVREERPETSSR